MAQGDRAVARSDPEGLVKGQQLAVDAFGQREVCGVIGSEPEPLGSVECEHEAGSIRLNGLEPAPVQVVDRPDDLGARPPMATDQAVDDLEPEMRWDMTGRPARFQPWIAALAAAPPGSSRAIAIGDRSVDDDRSHHSYSLGGKPS